MFKFGDIEKVLAGVDRITDAQIAMADAINLLTETLEQFLPDNKQMPE